LCCLTWVVCGVCLHVAYGLCGPVWSLCVLIGVCGIPACASAAFMLWFVTVLWLSPPVTHPPQLQCPPVVLPPAEVRG
jgi:hypothetical protein